MLGDAKAKYRRIHRELYDAILSGQYPVGGQIPTENQLSTRYRASRPTVARALRELERAGLLVRRRGIGSFVSERRATTEKLFGMILPWPGEGIFGPMADALVREGETQGYAILLAGSLMAGQSIAVREEEAFCEQLIARKVAGVFFGPLDTTPEQAVINTQIAERLTRAGIPIVLLDRDIEDSPRRSPFDLVGIDNRRETAAITTHLVRLGCRRIEFVTHNWVVSTTAERIAGYQDAMAAAGIGGDGVRVHRWNLNDRGFVRDLMRRPHAEAFVCVNDLVAGSLMHNLAVMGVRIPDDVRITGFDDIEAAARMPVPLTTVRQPAAHMGTVAMWMLLERLRNPSLPPRRTTLACELIVRDSCGAKRSDVANQPTTEA